MIINERQYLITQAQAAKFRHALAAPPAPGLHPKAIKAMRDAAQSQLAEIEEQLAEYDALRGGKVASFKADSIAGIGLALIKARIARQLTHKALAERMDLAEQQIQRYEATQYAGRRSSACTRWPMPCAFAWTKWSRWRRSKGERGSRAWRGTVSTAMANDERAALAKQIRTLQRELDQLPYMEADPPWSEHSSPEEDSAITGHGKTTQSVGDGRQGQRQRAAHEVREGLGGERRLREDEVYGLAVLGGLHGSDEGKLVQQAAHRLPFNDLTTPGRHHLPRPPTQ